MFYEGLKDLTEYGKKKCIRNPNFHINSSLEGLILGGLAGGMCTLLLYHPAWCTFKYSLIKFSN